MSEIASIVRSMPLFAGFTVAGAQRLIDMGEVKEHAAGEQLCKEGDAANSVLLIISGKLRAYVERGGAELVLADFSAGSIMGEIAVLCGLPRSASVRALDRSTVLYWNENTFYRLLLGDVLLSHRIFSASLRLLIEREKAMIESLTEQQRAGQAS
jgi:CRP-like cAMP-binding protein